MCHEPSFPDHDDDRAEREQALADERLADALDRMGDETLCLPHEPDDAELVRRAERIKAQLASYAVAERLSEAVNKLLREAL